MTRLQNTWTTGKHWSLRSALFFHVGRRARCNHVGYEVLRSCCLMHLSLYMPVFFDPNEVHVVYIFL